MVEQLRCVEKSTRGRDLSPVTDKLWRNFYVEEFGASRADQAVENTKKSNAAFKWKELYETKLEEVNKKEKKAAERLKSRYQMEAARKQSRRVVCTEAEEGRERDYQSARSGGFSLRPSSEGFIDPSPC
ncbi:hypothetical protein ACFX2F_005936 [Malus domestica]|uniref:uncharacterized protein n=1 Tax=Malus domestica TaxID=3750 RepID=UPI000498CF49|nr:uncharacterized protein LOC103412918 [Malus domestica]